MVRMNPLGTGLHAVVVSVLLAASAAPQQPPVARRQAPFKSGADVVPVDVNVLDRDGRPIENLTATDFALSVGGRPRRISSAEFVRTAALPAPASASPFYSSNAQGGSGRLVMLVIDQGNISAGAARATTESAIRFIKRLSPADRVGLLAIPAPGPQIQFTTNHALIQAQLPRIAGHATSAFQRVGLGEAARISRGDQMALSTVASRECSTAERLPCLQELESEAREILADARLRARNSIMALRAVMERLAESQWPKTVVYLSEALVIDQDRTELGWLGPLAAKGHVTLQVLRIDRAASDASGQRRASARGEDVAVAEEGLAQLADLTRGSLLRLVGNADRTFERLAREMSGYYLLGFEPQPGDHDGKPHKIKIDVPGRRGIEVRARQDFSVEPAGAQTSEDVLADTLRAPFPATDIGLRVTAYTFRESGSDALRILIAAEIDRSRNASSRLALGYALLDSNGSVMASQLEPELNAPIRDDTKVQAFVAAATARSPGVYALKLAVVDDAGQRGSVEHAFKAQLPSGGRVRAADLLIGESATTAEHRAAPTVAGDFVDVDALHGYVEIYSDTPEALEGAAVTFEIAEREDGRALESVPAQLDESTGTTNRRTAEGVLSIGLLPAGDYHARAIVTVDGRKAIQVGRPFRVVRAAAAVDASRSTRGRRSRAPAPFVARVDPFQRASVLTPQVVGFFVERMGAGPRPPVPPTAVEHTKAGRFDAASEAAGSDTLASAFLAGMSLYARGDLEGAAGKFREAIRMDSEFFPGVFYLGACYAAGGKDREAAAAWQTTLVTDTDAPFVYTLLGDAYLRQREIEQAIQILQEATERWPHEPQVQLRLGTALAMAGKSTEALNVLDSYLASHPGDSERVFIALRVLYEAHAAGRTVGTLEEDRTRFQRYAAAYAAAGGQHVVLVEQWKKVMAHREF